MFTRHKLPIILAAALFAFGLLASTETANAQRPFRPNMYDRFGETRRSRPTYRYDSESRSVTRSYSVEPISIKAGDTVKVTLDTPLMNGRDVLATVPEGNSYKVIQVIGPWVGIAFEKEGKQMHGWVNHRALESVD